MNFSTCVSSYNHQSNKDTQQFHHLQTSLCHPISHNLLSTSNAWQSPFEYLSLQSWLFMDVLYVKSYSMPAFESSFCYLPIYLWDCSEMFHVLVLFQFLISVVAFIQARICSSIHPLKHVWAVTNLGQLQTKTSKNFCM